MDDVEAADVEPASDAHEAIGAVATFDRMSDACAPGVCGADVPPLIGSILTGSGMTVSQAAAAIARGESPALTDVQLRIVEAWALEHPA